MKLQTVSYTSKLILITILYVRNLLNKLFFHRDISGSIENVWLQVKSIILTKLREKEQILSEDIEKALKDQILSLSNIEAPVRKLMWKRLIAYMRLVKTNKILPPVPPGYNDLSDELQSLANTFKRLTAYNYSVFGEHLEKMLDELSKSTNNTKSQAEATTTTNEPSKSADS